MSGVGRATRSARQPRRARPARVVARLVLGLGALVAASPAAAADCPAQVDAHLAHARDPLLLLLDLDRLRARAAFVADHAERAFPSPDAAWRVTGGVGLGTRFVLGARDCAGHRDGEVQPTLAHLGFTARAEHRPSGVALRVFGAGRMDSVLLTETDPGDSQTQLGYLRGLLGVGLQVTPWFEAAWAELGDTPIRGDDDDWRARVPLDDDAGPAHLLELGVPRLGLRAQFTDRGETLGARAFELRDLPVAWRLHAAFLARRLPVEDGWLVAPKLLYRHHATREAHLDVGLEIGLGTDDGGLRHVRASLEQLLLAAEPGRGASPGLGVRLEQRAELSVHRGPAVRALTDAGAAFGGGWRMLAGLQTPHAYVFFDFGVGFNDVELLDAVPVTRNRGVVDVGLHVETPWALGGG